MNPIVAAAFSFFYIALPEAMEAVPQQEVVRDQQSGSKKVQTERLKKTDQNIPTFRPKANLKIIPMNLVPTNSDER